jgi:hypothetical protein
MVEYTRNKCGTFHVAEYDNAEIITKGGEEKGGPHGLAHTKSCK